MKNNNDITELVFILDRSGSMQGLEKDTIGGFNAMIEKQKKQSSACYVSTILFNHESKVIYDREKIKEVWPMTEKDYEVGGTTALLDAVGGAIHHIGKLHKYFGESAPSKTMFVITTDGMENASRRYDAATVKMMIERQKEKYGWEFIFIGANIDAVETAAGFGIDADRAVNYNADSKGTKIMYESVAQAVCNLRASVPIDKTWRVNLDADYKKRGRRK